MPEMKLRVHYVIEVSTEVVVNVPDDALPAGMDVDDALYDYLVDRSELFDGKVRDTKEHRNKIELHMVEVLDE